MGATHDPNITINITLDAAPPSQPGFSKVLLLVPKATNPLGGVRAKTYGSIGEAQADADAGAISATTLAAATTAFSQSPKPSAFMVGVVDLVGGETYATGLAAVAAYDDSFYGVCITPRTGAEIDAVSTAVEAMTKIFACQNSDPSWLDAGYPAAPLSNLATRERTLIDYHDTDAQWMDVAHLARVLTANPDNQSAPFHMGVGGVNPYATALTDGQRSAALANYVNVGLKYGGAAFYIDGGKSATGRSMDEIVTADWLKVRLQADIAALIVRHSARFEKLTVTREGQSKIEGVIKARGQQGVAAGHFVPGQFNVRSLPIIQDDLDAGRLRFEGEAQLAVSGRLVSLNFAVGRSAVNVEV